MAKVRVSKQALWKAIRKGCLDCLGGSYSEVVNCTAGNGSPVSYQCPLYPYRLGRIERSNHPVESPNTPLQEGVNGSRTHSDGEVIHREVS